MEATPGPGPRGPAGSSRSATLPRGCDAAAAAGASPRSRGRPPGRGPEGSGPRPGDQWRCDAERRELLLRTDAGQQQQARRVDRAGAEDHFPGRAGGMPSAVVQEFEARATPAGERQLDHLRLGDDRQVMAARHRPQVGSRRTAAQPALDVEVHGADALGPGDVQVVEVRHPVGPARIDERGRHRVEAPGPFDVDRAPAPRNSLARPPSPPTV